MKLTHLKSKVLPAPHLSSTLHSMLPAYRIIEKAVWLPPRSRVMTMVMTMAPVGYPVDDITEMTHCELHVKVVNISMKVAVGYALPIGPRPTYHCLLFPEGYT